MNKAYRTRIFVLATTAALGSAGIMVPAATATAGTIPANHPQARVAPVVTAAGLAHDIVGFNAKYLQALGAKLAADITANAAASISVQANGLADSQLSTALDAALHAAIDASAAATIEARLGSVFGETLATRVTAILASKCPGGGPQFADCVRLNTPVIARQIVQLYVNAIAQISASVAAELDANIDASIALTIRDFEANLVLERLTVSGQASLEAHVTALVAAWIDLKTDAPAWTTAVAELILASVLHPRPRIP